MTRSSFGPSSGSRVYAGLALVWVGAQLAAGCPTGSDPEDARVDAALDTRADAGVTCSVERAVQCGSPARQCCNGFVVEFFDGVCAPHGGGGPGCSESYGVAGCPCATEDAEDCGLRGVYGYDQWMLRCTGGRWMEQTGFMCCF